MADLKSCPFCGGTNIHAFEGSTFRWGYLACTDCGGNRGDCRKADSALPADHETNIAGFAEDWNDRTSIGDTPAPQSKDGVPVGPVAGNQDVTEGRDG